MNRLKILLVANISILVATIYVAPPGRASYGAPACDKQHIDDYEEADRKNDLYADRNPSAF